ncbi:MAG: hypothetical protein Q9227_001688 [Pyrenula ochraceoflavens]
MSTHDERWLLVIRLQMSHGIRWQELKDRLRAIDVSSRNVEVWNEENLAGAHFARADDAHKAFDSFNTSGWLGQTPRVAILHYPAKAETPLTIRNNFDAAPLRGPGGFMDAGRTAKSNTGFMPNHNSELRYNARSTSTYQLQLDQTLARNQCGVEHANDAFMGTSHGPNSWMTRGRTQKGPSKGKLKSQNRVGNEKGVSVSDIRGQNSEGTVAELAYALRIADPYTFNNLFLVDKKDYNEDPCKKTNEAKLLAKDKKSPEMTRSRSPLVVDGSKGMSPR